VAHRQGDHVVRDGMSGEGTPRAGRETSTALRAAPPLSAQACVSIPPRSIAPTPYALHDQSFLNARLIILPAHVAATKP
jgi:hypothetical protein